MKNSKVSKINVERVVILIVIAYNKINLDVTTTRGADDVS